MIFSEGCNKLQAVLAKLAAVIIPLIKGVFSPGVLPFIIVWWQVWNENIGGVFKWKFRTTHSRRVWLNFMLFFYSAASCDSSACWNNTFWTFSGARVAATVTLNAGSENISTLVCASQRGSITNSLLWTVWNPLEPFSTPPPPTGDT